MNVICFRDRYRRAVIEDLEQLLAKARAGGIIGLGYAVVLDSRAVQAGLSGMLAKDRLKAAGILLGAATKSANGMCE